MASFLSSSRYFYPRSPCGERPYGRINDISRLIFLSTLSLRRATLMWYQCNTVVKISIHALLAESDDKPVQPAPAAVQFLSTLSLRRATYGRINDISRLIFLSTLSLRRATNNVLPAYAACGISIHALLAESDGILGWWLWDRQQFLSTLSLRRATAISSLPSRLPTFLSTLSLRRATQ